MKKIYTIIFVQNNVNKEENYLIDLATIKKDDDLVNKTLEKIVFSPRQQVIERILRFAREGK
jgi:hypothetical protein